MTIRETFEAAGQSHLFQFQSQVSTEDFNAFLSKLEALGDPKSLLSDVSNAIAYSSNVSKGRKFGPLPTSSFQSTLTCDADVLSNWESIGLDLIKNGKVAIILMAGGQGTRLGSSAPKGCYDVGLPSHKSLFQLQIERIRKLEKLANGSIHLYVMTSIPTRAATESFFKSNDYFGWSGDKITFFNQGTLPAVDLNCEKLLLGEDKASLVESPDGNGGLYRALYDNGILEDLKSKGIEHIHMYCVDNVLVKVGDPVFIGFSSTNDFHIATKVVRKESPEENVGLIVLDEEKNTPCVIEYSEISEELCQERDADGLLKLRAGNIVNHYYNVQFLLEMVPQWIASREYLPYHIAKKKVPFTNSNGEYIKPEEVNGIKLEQFIFDVFPSVPLEKFGCLEVVRAEEFSPLKNGPGSLSDSPETCRLDCLKRSTKWVTKAGGEPLGTVEISPLTSYSGEGLTPLKGVQFSDLQII